MANSDLVLSVAKALDVLKYIALQSESCCLRDLAQHFNMKTPALHNILRTMVDRKFLCKTADGKYTPGTALQEIANNLPDKLAGDEKLLCMLHEMYPKAVITLAEISSNAVICCRRISPDAPGQIQTPVNRTFPPYTGVTGLVTISCSGLSADELENRWPFEDFGQNEWENREKFLETLARCRKNGFAVKKRNSTLTMAVALQSGRTLGFCLTQNDMKNGTKVQKEILDFISRMEK